MSCERYAPYLSGFAGGELRSDTRRIVAAHLETCAECSAEADRQRLVVAGMRSLSEAPVAVPFGLVEDILARVEGHERLGGLAAAVPLPVAERARVIVSDPRLRQAAGQVGGAARQAADRLSDRRTRAAAAATTAAVAGGIVALVTTRRRRIARSSAPA